MIEDSSISSVGGDIQLTIVNNWSFTYYWIAGSDKPSSIKFRNIDLINEIGFQVGECSLIMQAMDLSI